MAVGRGSLNRVSKTAETVKETVVKETEVKEKPAVQKKPAAPKKAAEQKKPAAARKTTVAKPSKQVEKLVGKKDAHYGLGQELPAFLM